MLMAVYLAAGSPPPTRGTPSCPLSSFSSSGITPAYAGNTRIKTRVQRLPRDHPRLRGEHVIFLIYLIPHVGSPPPTRGTLVCRAVLVAFSGITPAYAGNTKIYTVFSIKIKDHPRLRGEHAIASIGSCILLGSPPPTRGTLTVYNLSFCPSGITPAYAGNTRSKRIK